MEGLRSKGDRVREVVEILTKLKSLGIPSNDVGYLLTKEALDAWIHNGNEASHKIPFPLANRTGHLELPSKLSDSIKFVLRLDSAGPPEDTPEDSPEDASGDAPGDADADAPQSAQMQSAPSAAPQTE